MVKLIRLESDNKCHFDCNLKDSLILKPYSKIGLSNISWEKLHQEFQVDSSNNEISIEFIDAVNGNSTLTATLTNQTYSYLQVNNLLEDMENKLNNMLVTSTPKCVGMNIKVEVDKKDGFVHIVSYQNNLIDFFRTPSSTDANFQNIGIESAGTVYSKTAATNAYDSALFGKNEGYFFRTDRGCGVFRCQINNLATTGVGFYIGLSSIEPENMGGDFNFTISKLDFGIEVQNTNQTYRYIKNVGGTVTHHLTAVSPTVNNPGDATNDVLEISCSGGKIIGRVYNSYGSHHQFFSEEYSSDLDVLYPIVGFKDNNNCAIQNLRYTPKLEQVASAIEETDYSSLSEPPPTQQRNNIDFNITFENQALSDYLGFSQRVYNLIDVNAPNINADSIIEPFDRCESYIVELQSLALDSYDMSKSKEKRRYILALIQNQKNRLEKDVVFEPYAPLMVDINNSEPILLKNLQMRVLNTDENEINIFGTSNALITII